MSFPYDFEFNLTPPNLSNVSAMSIPPNGLSRSSHRSSAASPPRLIPLVRRGDAVTNSETEQDREVGGDAGDGRGRGRGRGRDVSRSGSSSGSGTGDSLPLKGGASVNNRGQLDDVAARKTTSTALSGDRTRQHRRARTGGFLLETPLPSTGRNDGELHHQRSAEYPSKQESNGGELVIPKQRLRSRIYPKDAGINPRLRTQVPQPQPSESGSPYIGYPLQHSRSASSPSRYRRPATAKTLPDPRPSSDETGRQEQGQQQQPPGMDIDPAQLVSLALNLSESRKRSYVSSRLAPFDTGGGRRIFTPNIVPSPHPQQDAFTQTQGGALRQQLMQQRMTPRNMSPLSIGSQSRPFSPNPPFYLATSSHGSPSPENARLIFSEATIARAQKAIAFFEERDEYIRLLPYLPPLKTSAKNFSRPRTQSRDDVDGRAYNPLQYIRNRRIRYRQKRAFNAEWDDWRDLDLTREWVKDVIERAGQPSNDPYERLRLPALPGSDFDEGEVGEQPTANAPFGQPPSQSTSSFGRPGTAVGAPRLKRPKIDWIISPADLLADVTWVEKEDNRRLIEDARGNKIYPPHIPLHVRNLCDDDDETPGIGLGVSEFPPINEEVVESPVALTDLASNLSVDKIRKDTSQMPKIRDSMNSLQRSSGSGKPSWAKLSKSRSISSISSTDDDRSFKLKKRTYQDLITKPEFGSAALEKRMQELLEMEAEKNTRWENQEVDISAYDSAQSSNQESDLSRQLSLASSRAHQRPASPRRAAMLARQRTRLEENSRNRISLEGDDIPALNPPAAANQVPIISINLSPDRSPLLEAARDDGMLPKQKISRLDLEPPQEEPHAEEDANLEEEAADRVVDDVFISQDASQNVPQMHSLSRGASLDIRRDVNRPQFIRQTSLDIHRAESRATSFDADRSVSASGNGFSLRKSLELYRPKLSHLNGTGRKKLKDGSDAKVRGRKKIASLVSHKVSKVGDFIFGKETSQKNQSPAASVHSPDSEVEPDQSLPANMSSKEMARVSTKLLDNSSPSRSSSRPPSKVETAARMYTRHLPKFKSSIKGDVSPRLLTSIQSPNATRLGEVELRGRPKTANALKPPQLGIHVRSATPSPTRRPKLVETISSSNIESRYIPGRGAFIGNADLMLYNQNIISPNSSSIPYADRLPVTFDSIKDRDKEKRKDGNDRASVPELPPTSARSSINNSISSLSARIRLISPVTRKRLLCVRAQILITGIKASQRYGFATTVSDDPPAFLSSQIARNVPVVPVPRFQEPNLAATILLSDIDETNAKIRQSITRFRDNKLDRLLVRLRELDAQINEGLSPRIRSLADGAAALTTELTTTRTLAVKQLNDSIDLMYRRRRRRLRYLRRTGFVLLEWVLLGIMWWAWCIVMCIKALLGIKRGFVAAIKWALWLN